jgi:hypothetical protein
MSSNIIHFAEQRSSIPLLMDGLRDHIGVMVAAVTLGYYERALEAHLLVMEALEEIRRELLRPRPGVQHPRRDFDA